MKNWHYALAVFLGGCCFGILSTFVKVGYNAGFTAAQITSGQFTFGLVLILMISAFTKKQKVTVKEAIKIAFAGIPMGLTGTFYYLSLQTLDASLAIIFLFQFIWIGSLYEWIFYKRKPTRKKSISIIIILFGSLLASGFITANQLTVPLEGMIWGTLSAFSFSAFIFVSGAVAKHLPPIQKSALLSIGGWLATSIIAPPLFLFDLPLLIGLTKYSLFLGIFGVCLPPILFSFGMPHVGPGLGTILSASELPVALIMSTIILAELVTPLQWFGAVLILAGITYSNMTIENKQTDLSAD